jgi:hypothetical protein
LFASALSQDKLSNAYSTIVFVLLHSSGVINLVFVARRLGLSLVLHSPQVSGDWTFRVDVERSPVGYDARRDDSGVALVTMCKIICRIAFQSLHFEGSSRQRRS